MFQALSEPPTKIMILGCSCSIATVATAQVSHRFNLTQVRRLQIYFKLLLKVDNDTSTCLINPF